MYAQVCFPFFSSKTFTYKIPKKYLSILKAGDLVEVKFKNKVCKGFVVSLSNRIAFKGSLNEIISIKKNNQIPQDLWKTLLWMSNYYVTPIGKITQTTISWAFKDNTVKNKDIKGFEGELKSTESLILNEDQTKVFNKINDNYGINKKPQFLYGVPGSGKTEVYIKLAAKTLLNNQSSLILIPEIALSSQIFLRFQTYFGDKVLLWHSQSTESYKKKVLIKLNENNSYIVIGARSALFTPISNLGLIVVDEEHDASYKESERQPCYHARDLSIIRSKYANALILLGSATPSLETYYNAMIINKYDIHELKNRYGNAQLPQVKIIDMNQNTGNTNDQNLLSTALINKINTTLDNKEQVLILHNRRGFSSIKICRESDEILKCKNCDVILTFHAELNQLICHHCHQRQSFQKYTKQDISFLGYGTEQIETVLNQLFPKAGVIRMDSDSANSLKKQKDILTKFKNKEFNILLGTQMIAKGLDFSNITLVAVMHAELGMLIPDYRSHERMYQLLYQVIGRSGRSSKIGNAIIQTYQPDNHLIQMATNYQSKKFYNLNLESRKSLQYPPFVRLVRFIFQSKNINKCRDSANKVYKILNAKFSNSIIGPLPCPIERLANQERFHIILKIKPEKLKRSLIEIKKIQDKKNSLISTNVKLLIDVDSISVL